MWFGSDDELIAYAEWASTEGTLDQLREVLGLLVGHVSANAAASLIEAASTWACLGAPVTDADCSSGRASSGSSSSRSSSKPNPRHRPAASHGRVGTGGRPRRPLRTAVAARSK